MAIGSLIGVLPVLLTIFCGVMGLRATRGGAMRGRGLAWYGIVVGCLSLAAVAWAAVPMGRG